MNLAGRITRYTMYMAKRKKKRNKVYQGSDAKIQQPTVIRMEAANRNKLSQWWFEKKRVAKPVLIASAVVTLLVWFIVELVVVVF